MTKGEAVKWITNLMADIGEPQYSALWHYEQALSEIRGLIETEPEIIRCKDCKHQTKIFVADKKGGFHIYGCELADEGNSHACDSISRQATIDALGTPHGILYPIRTVEELPSVQPQSEIIRCKDCRHRIVNEHYGERGYLDLKAYCELDSGDPFELSREAENDDWFCADAERKETP